MNDTPHNNLVFVKLGGSLITDKRRRATPRKGTLKRLASELREALDATPQLQILLGHGSGSFGHWEAQKYNTRQGVKTPDQWHGFAQVSAAAARLNRLVVDIFLDVGVPVISLQPSAVVSATSGKIETLPHHTINQARQHGLVPLIYGDVAFDNTWGGTILSTETLFFHLCQHLQPAHILLLGNAPGVLDNERHIIPAITPASYPHIERHLRGSRYTDVTGGMADKVKQMVDLVQRIQGLQVWILTGREPDNLKHALLDPLNTPGTRIALE